MALAPALAFMASHSGSLLRSRWGRRKVGGDDRGAAGEGGWHPSRLSLLPPFPCAPEWLRVSTKSAGPQGHSSSTSVAHGMLVTCRSILPNPSGDSAEGRRRPGRVRWSVCCTRIPNPLEDGPACPVPIPAPTNPDLCSGHLPDPFTPPVLTTAQWGGKTETQRDEIMMQ